MIWLRTERTRYHLPMSLNPSRSRSLRSGLLLLVGACALSGSPAQQPAPPTYNVEMIIFRNSSVGAAEDWSTPGVRQARGAAEAGEATPGGAQVGRFVALIPAAQYQLNELQARMSASGAYTPIAHAAWSQTPSSWGSRAGFQLERLGVAVPGLSGMIYLERATYLHLGMSLKYTPPNGGPRYDLTEIRRVKFYEKNYYDHPAFGVIAVVTPAQGARPPGR